VEEKTHDVSLLKDAVVIGHVPRGFSRVFWHFLKHGGTITCEDTGVSLHLLTNLLPSASSAGSAVSLSIN